MNKIRITVVLVFLLVMGVVLTVSGVRDIIRINGYVPDFNFDSMADIKKGGFVQGYVENIFDCYASETTTETTMGIETSSRTSEEYFLMPLINESDVDNELYVTISASNINDRKLLYAVCNDTWEYLDGNTDIDFTEMYIVARVKKMDSDLMPLLTDWFTSAGIYGSAAEAADNRSMATRRCEFQIVGRIYKCAVGPEHFYSRPESLHDRRMKKHLGRVDEYRCMAGCIQHTGYIIYDRLLAVRQPYGRIPVFGVCAAK